jgi:hypothetical protein
MSPDLIRALAISGGILMAVVVLIVVVSSIAVKRGEVEMAADHKRHGHGH